MSIAGEDRTRTDFSKNTLIIDKMRALFVFAAACMAMAVSATEEKKVVCYFGSWAVYRPGAGKFAIEDIDPKMCTHLIYTFVGLSGDNVRVLDGWQDLPDNWGKDGFGRFNALRKNNPSLKTLVAIGGWNEGSTKYSQMAADPKSRATFVKNVVAFVKKHDFDGFDVDWEYPAQRGGQSYDVKNFVALLKELREAFDPEGLLLTAAVGAAESSASQSYDIPQVSKYLHFINLMTYDLHGSWEPHTGLNAPLYPGSSDQGSSRKLTVEASVKYWLDQGAPREKLIVGVASYGRSFTLANPNAAAVGDATRGAGAAGPYTREPGMLGYNEICDMQQKQKWTVKFDEERRVPYAYRENQWVGYDNVKSITEKAEYIKKLGLGGAMIWSIETDDFKGKCGEKYPLINSLNFVLRNGKKVVETTTPEHPEEVTEGPKTTPVKVTPGKTTPRETTPLPPVDGECTAAGNMADKNTCSHFIQCVPTAYGTYEKVVVPCAPGLCFKAETGVCDWK